jgi:hypothetical protein
VKSTLVGQLISADGWNCRSYFSDDPADFWHPIRHRTWVVDPSKLRPTQASKIPLRVGHGTAPVGELVYLQRRNHDGSLWCVADIDSDLRPLPDRDYFLSVEAEWNERDGGDVVVKGAALCERSAMLGLAPIVWLRDGLDQRGKSARRLGTFHDPSSTVPAKLATAAAPSHSASTMRRSTLATSTASPPRAIPALRGTARSVEAPAA